MIFYESSTSGVFDGEATMSGTSDTKVESNLDGFRLVAVPTNKSSSYERAYFSTTSGSSHVTNTDYGMLTYISNDASSNRITVDSNDSGCSLDIVDEYGTNIGTPEKTLNEYQFFGVKHKTTTSSTKIFNGIRVTLSKSSAASMISSGYTLESSLVYLFPASYTGAIVLQSGTSGSVTIEFLYRDKGEFTITLDANGGEFSDGETTHTTTVTEGDTFTFSDEPTREDYSFEYWLNGTVTYETGDSYVPTNNDSFYAAWSGGPEPTPTPVESKDHMVRSSNSNYLIYNRSSGALVYAV